MALTTSARLAALGIDQRSTAARCALRGIRGTNQLGRALSRNRRIFNDPAGLAAGQNQRAYLVQSYARDMGNGNTVMMREIDVPIRVKGRHWGGFRTAYRL